MLFVVGACGEVTDPNRLPDAPLQSDGPAADAPVDAPPAPRCDPNKPFGAPVAVNALNSNANDLSPWLTEDELTVYFASTRAGGVGGLDIYVATRPDRMSGWGTPAILAGVNTTASEARPTLTADGLTMYAVQTPVGSTDSDIVVATRSSPSASFGAFTPVTRLNDTDVDASPVVLGDHSAVYLTSRRGGANNIQIYRSTRANGMFAPPALVIGTMLDVFDDHATIAITPDELVLYFSSTRSGGTGGADVWVASRASLAVGFSAPTQVTEVNTTDGELPLWISADTCVLYMTRTAGAAAQVTRILRAEKPL